MGANVPLCRRDNVWLARIDQAFTLLFTLT
jgi:hypothetical protein